MFIERLWLLNSNSFHCIFKKCKKVQANKYWDNAKKNKTYRIIECSFQAFQYSSFPFKISGLCIMFIDASALCTSKNGVAIGIMTFCLWQKPHTYIRSSLPIAMLIYRHYEAAMSSILPIWCMIWWFNNFDYEILHFILFVFFIMMINIGTLTMTGICEFVCLPIPNWPWLFPPQA